MNTSDLLSRQPYLDLLKSIITHQQNNPSGYSFAIDGEWGCGKTWVLNELEKQLAEDLENKYLIFHYNAWENDFYDEPLVAILSVMIEKLNKVTSQKSLYDAAVDELLKQVSVDLLTLVSGIVKEVTKIDVEEIIKRKKGFFKRIKDNTKLSAKDIDALIPLQHTLQEVRKNLKKLSEKFHILLIVDELDRCLPEYTIKVLERLHHVCNEMPVIQIIAYSKNALAHSIAQIFGNNSSNGISKRAFAEHYLEKFVKLTLPLNYGAANNDLHCMYEGLEQKYHPCFDGSEDFLKQFYKVVLERLPIRNKKQILDTVKMVHELVLASEHFKDFTSTYELLCCEILISIDRILFHAQSPLNVSFMEKENTLHLYFKADSESRYSDIMAIEDFIKIFETIVVQAQKQQEPLWEGEWYNVPAGNSIAIIFLTFADGKNLQVESNYSYPLGSPCTKIISQNKEFIEKFYSFLYRFFIAG